MAPWPFLRPAAQRVRMTIWQARTRQSHAGVERMEIGLYRKALEMV